MSVLGNKPADKALSSDDIQDGAISTNDLANNSVTTPKIADSNITTDKLANNSITPDKFAFSGSMGNRNVIIGGDFTTNPWQRGTSFAAIATGGFSADRWVIDYSSSAVFTVSKSADAPTVAQAGVFTQHSYYADITTADTALSATDIAVINQRIEGYNAVSFGFGQSGLRYVTLSFWVKATKTGVYCVSFANSAADRSYVAEYTVSTSNTWEKKIITIPVDTTGTWLYDNGIGLRVRFALAAGTNYIAPANTWSAGNLAITTNQINALDNTANDFKIALVQLEAGEVATPFETRSYGQELSLCQRYYQFCGASARISATASGQYLQAAGNFLVSMRATPNATLVAESVLNVTARGFTPVNAYSFRLEAQSSASGDAYILQRVDALSAEL
jgi:hypothetical protein